MHQFTLIEISPENISDRPVILKWQLMEPTETEDESEPIIATVKVSDISV